MIKTLRNQSPILMAILLAVISLSFLVFFNLPTVQGLSGGSLGKIGGHAVSQEEFRIADQAAQLMVTFSGRGGVSGADVQRLAWQRLLLLDAAREMKLSVADADVAAAIRRFLGGKDGQFDPNAYDVFVKNILPSQGLDESRFEQIMRENLLIDKAREAIVAPARVAPEEVDRIIALEMGPAKLSAVRLSRADFLSAVPVDAAAVDKEIKDHADFAAYRTPEKRSVSWVLFPLSAADQKLAGKELVEAKRKLGQQAQDFAIAALDGAKSDPKAFASLAEQKGAAAQATAPFAKTESPAGLPPSPSFNRAAFELTTDIPVSDAVPADRGFYVLQLVAVTPSIPLPPEQLRPLAEKNLRERLAFEELQKRGSALAAAIRQGLAAGKPFAAAVHDAAAAAGTPKAAVQSLTPLVPVEASPSTPDAETLAALLVGDGGESALEPGSASDFIPTQDGGLIAFLEKRDAPDPAKVAPIRQQVAASLLGERRQQLINEWGATLDRRSGYEAPPFLSRR